jgi:DNA-binding GntR family transcriptional regulator
MPVCQEVSLTVREVLLALEKEGTVIISPYKGAIVRPLSATEVLDIAELRLALISLASNRRTVTSRQPTLTMPTTWQSD